MSIVFIGMLALAVDVGYLLTERRSVQAAADSAALAAAVAAYHSDSANIESSATDYAIENAGVGSDDVDFQSPPASGHYAGESDYFQVTVRKDVQRFFLGAVYTGDWSVEASAVAGVETEGWATGLIALNPDGGGIQTSGSSTITVDGASVISNWKIQTSGYTIVNAGQAISANDGFVKSGTTIFNAPTQNDGAPEVPDPLLDKIDPPTLPSFPGNPVSNASNSTTRTGGQIPGWNSPYTYVAPAGGTWNGSGYQIAGNSGGGAVRFPSGNYTFQNGAQISTNYPDTILEGGVWNFKGSGSGLNIGGSTPRFEMQQGEYSFTNGASFNIGGNSPNNIIGSGGTDYTDTYMYFSGGGGLQTGGSNDVTIYPGTYIFDGGPGFTMSGNAKLTFMPGTYEFWFRNGADFSFSGSSKINLAGDTWVKMYFVGSSSNTSNLQMSGDTNFQIPSGEYYFDRGQMLNSGSTRIHGEEVFLYFKNGSYLSSSGMGGFSFTAPDWEIYPGYYPGVYMYSDRDNTASFRWDGYSTSVSEGIVYLPASPLYRSGYSYGMQWRGQLIVDSLIVSGNNMTGVEYVEYVETEIPSVYLVE